MADRFEFVLRGRRQSPWGEWVGISQGTLSRLKKGELPDPVKLTAACRAENLSLTWLLDGIGAPYIVHTPADLPEGVAHVRALLEDEGTWFPLIVASNAGRALVLHQPATINIAGGICEYRAVAVIGGAYDVRAMTDALGLTEHALLVAMQIEDHEWRRLVTGYMSSTELFGWRDNPGGLYEAARRAGRYDVRKFDRPQLRVAEPPLPPYSAEVRELQDAFDMLTAGERDTVLRMLRGLKS